MVLVFLLAVRQGATLHSVFSFDLTPLSLQGGSEEAGSVKSRADKTKKLADYDRRLQESKDNVAVWMAQVKTVVDVSRVSFRHFLHS